MDQSRAGPSSRVFLAVTLPGFAALLAAALIVIERAAVDPTVSAGVEGSSSVPAWYVPLGIFASLHAFALAWLAGGRSGPVAALALAAIAACFLLPAGPLVAAEVIYGVLTTILYVLVVGLVAWPLVAIFAVALAGGLYGLAIYLPAALARRKGAAPGAGAVTGVGGAAPLVLAGICVAVACSIVFGDPTWNARAARGRYNLPAEAIGASWTTMAAMVAAGCGLVGFAGLWSFGFRDVLGRAFLIVAGLPLAAGVWLGWLVLATPPAPDIGRFVDAVPGLDALARHARDGRPRASEPIAIGGRLLAIDRGLVRYRLADNAARRVSTVAFRPTPDLAALGVLDTVVLNDGRAESVRADAERRGAACTPSPSGTVIECRFPNAANPAYEIDATQPTRSFHRAECRVILATIAGTTISAHIKLDCGTTVRWEQTAAGVERVLAGMLGVTGG